MYDQFFKSMLRRKREESSISLAGHRKTIVLLEGQLQKLNEELERQKISLKSELRPTRKKEVEENISALTDAINDVNKQIGLHKSSINLNSEESLLELRHLYLSLKQHPDIKDIEINEEKKIMIIKTNNLLARKTWIGEYLIGIDFNKHDIEIRRADGLLYLKKYHHPFISGDDVCFGNADSKISKALKQGGFYSITLICLELLKYSGSGANPFVSWSDFRRWVIKKIPQNEVR